MFEQTVQNLASAVKERMQHDPTSELSESCLSILMIMDLTHPMNSTELWRLYRYSVQLRYTCQKRIRTQVSTNREMCRAVRR